MLPDSLRPVGFDTSQKEDWDQYRTRLALPPEEVILQFYRQVVYDHYAHFNAHYPSFDLSQYSIELREFTAQEADDLIRFFGNETIDWWAEQYDEFEMRKQPYIIFQAMSETLTFPFPPIVIDAALLTNSGKFECGRPLHLVEGTHRVSYLRHMLRRGLVSPSSTHTFVPLQPQTLGSPPKTLCSARF